MILQEIQALPPDEEATLFQNLDREPLAPGKISGAELFSRIEAIGPQMRTSLTADEMNAARPL